MKQMVLSKIIIDKKESIEKVYAEANRFLNKEGVFIAVTPNCNLIMHVIYTITGNSYLIDSKFHPN